jgi:hypothetical protein
MILEHQRFLEIMFLIRRRAGVKGGPLELDVILNEDTVMKNGHVGWRHNGPIVGKARSAS